jgi:hypothetical protein
VRQHKVLASARTEADLAEQLAKIDGTLAENEAQNAAARGRLRAEMARLINGEGDANAMNKASAEIASLTAQRETLIEFRASVEGEHAEAMGSVSQDNARSQQRALKALLAKNYECFVEMDAICDALVVTVKKTFASEQAVLATVSNNPAYRMPGLTLHDFLAFKFAEGSEESLLGGAPLPSQCSIPGAADRKARETAKVYGRRGTPLQNIASRRDLVLRNENGEKTAPEPVGVVPGNVFTIPAAQRPGGIVEVLAHADQGLSPAAFLKRYNFDPASLPAEVREAAARLRAEREGRSAAEAAAQPVEAGPALPASAPAAPVVVYLSPEQLLLARGAVAGARKTKDRSAIRSVLNQWTGVRGAECDMVRAADFEAFIADIAALPIIAK